MKLMTYQNKRGGRVILEDIKKPASDEWGTAENAVAAALQLEKDVNAVSTSFVCIDLHIFGLNKKKYQ